MSEEETVVYRDTSVVIGEYVQTFLQSIFERPGKMTWNGAEHTVVITTKQLLFLPNAINAELKTLVAKGVVFGIGMAVGGGQVPRNVMQKILAAEGFDIFGKRSLSFYYIGADDEGSYVEQNVVGFVVIRKNSTADAANDFLSLPTPAIGLKFKSDQLAREFLSKLRDARRAWLTK